jgi:hypothetical protein
MRVRAGRRNITYYMISTTNYAAILRTYVHISTYHMYVCTSTERLSPRWNRKHVILSLNKFRILYAEHIHTYKRNIPPLCC